MKLKAEVSIPDVTEVEFWLDDALLGTATNAPYNFVWFNRRDFYPIYGFFVAVARTSTELEYRTEPLRTWFRNFHFQTPDVILTPPERTMIVAGSDFELTAEVVRTATRTSTWPLGIYFDRQLFVTNVPPMRATTPPTTLVITNVAEGEHTFGVQYSEGGEDCTCLPRTLRAVRLGIHGPALQPDGKMGFQIVTAFPGKETLIEASRDLVNWTRVQTVTPDTNYYNTTVPPGSVSYAQFFRVRLAEAAP